MINFGNYIINNNIHCNAYKLKIMESINQNQIIINKSIENLHINDIHEYIKEENVFFHLYKIATNVYKKKYEVSYFVLYLLIFFIIFFANTNILYINIYFYIYNNIYFIFIITCI